VAQCHFRCKCSTFSRLDPVVGGVGVYVVVVGDGDGDGDGDALRDDDAP
jgi:hypothetical protein